MNPRQGLDHPARDFESPAFVRSATPPELKIIGMLSMTGFGKGEAQSQNWRVRTLIRSLNGKGLDVSLRMPSFLIPIESKIKEKVKKRLRRGSVHVLIDVEPVGASFPIDRDKLSKNVEFVKSLAQQVGLKLGDDTVFEYSWKYSEKTINEVEEELEKAVLESLSYALEELVESRRKEGSVLKKDLKGRAENIEKLLERIELKKDEIINSIKERVIEKANRLELPEEHPVVINEILFLLEKMDVEEEVTRLKAHLERFKKTLNSDGDIGKKLEFIAQEMHREINTLGNKIPNLSEYVVDIKAEIDRIKQQSANVE